MAKRNRPLSPHLQVYRWQLTMVMSILHRATGVFLSVGSILLVYWLLSLAGGPASFSRASILINSWLGSILLALWAYALLYHLCNGIRHLLWDTGHGFEISQVYKSGWTVVLASLVLWVITLLMAFSTIGGGA